MMDFPVDCYQPPETVQERLQADHSSMPLGWYVSLMSQNLQSEVTFSATVARGYGTLISIKGDTLAYNDFGEQIQKICTSLKLSKMAIAEILGVSRQTIYDWIANKHENVKNENIQRVQWLIDLSLALDSHSQENLWLWRDKNISDHLSLKQALINGSLTPEKLAQKIKLALHEWQNIERIDRNISAREHKGGLIDKSYPFENDA